MNSQEIISALQKRYAVKTFDPAKKVSNEDLHIILESGRLSPSSVGLEPWKFIVVENPELRKQMRSASYDQTKVTEASHIIVITYRTDASFLPSELLERTSKTQGKTKEDLLGLQKMAEGTVAGKEQLNLESWLKAQTYIPLGIMIETASLLGIDNCPMEGFDSKQINEILGLEQKNLRVSTMLALGYRGDDAYAKLPKVRRVYNEVVEIIK